MHMHNTNLMIVYIPVFIHKFIPGMDIGLGSYEIQNSQHLAVMFIYDVE